MKIRVYYEDTDTGGIVYHSKYLNFCERARSELFFGRGMLPAEGTGSGFVVSKIEADFLGTAELGDTLEVSTELIETGRSTVWLKQSVTKNKKIIFEMKIRLAYLSRGRISRIPEKFMEILGSL